MLVSLAVAAEARADDTARGSGSVYDKPLLPDQFFGIMISGPVGILVGKGASKVAQPEAGYALSLQVMVLQHWWANLDYGQRFPLGTAAPAGGSLLNANETTFGLRGRLPSGPTSHLILAGGVGYSILNSLDSGGNTINSTNGLEAFVTVGMEKEIFGEGSSGGYVALEATYDQWFTPPVQVSPAGSPFQSFQGGMLGGRVAFSYYFGGVDAQECW